MPRMQDWMLTSVSLPAAIEQLLISGLIMKKTLLRFFSSKKSHKSNFFLILYEKRHKFLNFFLNVLLKNEEKAIEDIL